MKKLFFWMSLVSLMASCTSTTTIRTNDPDVSIYVDGEFRGKGQIFYQDQKIVFSNTHVMLKKNGGVPQNFIFSRNEEADIGAIIGGLFVYVPFLWTMKYRPDHYYEYEASNHKASKKI